MKYSSWVSGQSEAILKLQFLFVFLLAGVNAIYGLWGLVPREVSMQRWLLLGIFCTMTIVTYLLRKIRPGKYTYYLLIATNLFFAAGMVFIQRGMASRSSLLFAVPIIIALVSLSLSLLYVTVILSAIIYWLIVLAYYTQHPNEGYLAELYAQVLLHVLVFMFIGLVGRVFIHKLRSKKT
jgi:hypothetical protein